MTFISACAGIATIYARFKFVEKLSDGTVVKRLNKAALGLGLISCLGMCIVASFQETTVPIGHDIGALLFFVTGIVYIILQSIITHHASPLGSSISVFRIRCMIAVLAALALFPTIICAIFVKTTALHRHKEDEDYRFHIVSAVCEWIVAFSFIFFFFTYIHDFKLFTLRVTTEYEE